MRRSGAEDEDGRCQAFFSENWADFLAENGLGREAFARFRTIIWHHYLRNRRSFSWREAITPYRVLVSEVMLQQTQTGRVAPIFDRFVARFPDFQALAEAPFAEVLGTWQGLGYNRRARYLQDAAHQVHTVWGGVLPASPEQLVQLPGIGTATAASICVFAFNQPIAFIETNIRSVFLHFFFPTHDRVDDREIVPLVARTLDRERPRDWFYALMDYGVLLKRLVGNVSRRSRHYQRQSRFSGSDRQVRGKMLRLLLDRQVVRIDELPGILDEPQERVARLLDALGNEGLIVRRGVELRLD